MKVLSPEDALHKINGEKERNLTIYMNPYTWRSANLRAKKMGFDTIETYIENLISFDMRQKAIDKVLAKEYKKREESNYPFSRIADQTGLDIDIVVACAPKI